MRRQAFTAAAHSHFRLSIVYPLIFRAIVCIDKAVIRKSLDVTFEFNSGQFWTPSDQNNLDENDYDVPIVPASPGKVA